MLETTSWNDETVIQKFQNEKKHHLKIFEDNIDIVHRIGELGKQGSQLGSITEETLNSFIANTEITIENIYIRFEETDLKFCMGLLIPKVEGYSVDSAWNKVEKVIQTAVMYKKMTIQDVSLFVNYGEKFTSIDQDLDLGGFRESQNQRKLQKADYDKLGSKVNKYIRNTFKDSSERFEARKPGKELKNMYIYQEKPFTIDSQLQVTLNRPLAQREHGGTFTQPDFKVKLLFGGLFKPRKKRPARASQAMIGFDGVIQSFVDTSDDENPSENPSTFVNMDNSYFWQNPSDQTRQQEDFGEKQNDLISMSLDEHQLVSILHFVTFMTCYNNFSQGVLQNKFYSQYSDFFHEHEQENYSQLYIRVQEEKTLGNEAQAKTLLEQLFNEYDCKYRIDLILLLRDITCDRFYKKNQIEMLYEHHRNEVQGGKYGLNKMFKSGGGLPTGGQHKKSKEQQLRELDQEKFRQLQLLEESISAKVDQKRKIIDKQFGDNQVDEVNNTRDLEIDSDDDQVMVGAASWFEFGIRLPKIVVKFYTIDTNEADLKKISDSPMSVISLEGLQMKYITKSIPLITDFTVKLEKIEIVDPQIKDIVRKLHPELPKGKLIVEHVLDTVAQQDQGGNESGTNDANSEFHYSNLTEDFNAYVENGQQRKRLHKYLATFNMFVGELQHKRQSKEKSQSEATSAEDNNSAAMPAQTKGRSEVHTEVDLQVHRRIIIYSNFSWLVKIFKLSERTSNDMMRRKKYLIDSLDKKVTVRKGFVSYNSDERAKEKIRQNIINGFQFVQQLSKYAEEKMETVRTERLAGEDQTENLFRFTMSALSPKLILDEYLLAEKVLDPKNPAYLLIDMGRWTATNCIIRSLVEAIPTTKEMIQESHLDQSKKPELNQGHYESEKQKGTYETFEMKFKDLKIIYSKDGIESLLDKHKMAHETFTVFDKFNFGFQYQTLVKKQDETYFIPEQIINLMFEKLLINYDRAIFCQVLKIYGFFNHGTWNQALHDMLDQIEKEKNMFANYNDQARVDPDLNPIQSTKSAKSGHKSVKINVNQSVSLSRNQSKTRSERRNSLNDQTESDMYLTAHDNTREEAEGIQKPSDNSIKNANTIHRKSVKFNDVANVKYVSEIPNQSAMLLGGERHSTEQDREDSFQSENISEEDFDDSQQQSTGLRVNLSFSEFKVTVQKVNWQERESQNDREERKYKTSFQQSRPERLQGVGSFGDVPTKTGKKYQKLLKIPNNELSSKTPDKSALKKQKTQDRQRYTRQSKSTYKRRKLFEVEKAFEFGADSFKIMTDIPDQGKSLDLLVMLEKIHAKDLQDSNNMFQDLLEQHKPRNPRGRKLWKRTHDKLFTAGVKNLKMSLRKAVGVSQDTSIGSIQRHNHSVNLSRVRDKPSRFKSVEKPSRPSNFSYKQKNFSHVQVGSEEVFGLMADNVTTEIAQNQEEDSDHDFDFGPFKEFYPRQEYENDVNQLAFKYSLSVQEYKKSQSQREIEFDAEEANVKTLKVKKIKVIANFAVVEKLMLFAFNAMHDYENVDAEYKAHIELGKLNDSIKQQYLGLPSDQQDTDRANNEAQEQAQKGFKNLTSDSCDALDVSEGKGKILQSAILHPINSVGLSILKSEEKAIEPNNATAFVRRDSTLNSLKRFVSPVDPPLRKRSTVAQKLSAVMKNKLDETYGLHILRQGTIARGVMPSNEVILEQDEENLMSAVVRPEERDESKYKKKVLQRSSMNMKFSEIQLCIPTNTSEKDCLKMKVKTQFNYQDSYEAHITETYRRPENDFEKVELTQENKISNLTQTQQTKQDQRVEIQQLRMYMSGEVNQEKPGSLKRRSSTMKAGLHRNFLSAVRQKSEDPKPSTVLRQPFIISPINFVYASNYTDFQHDLLRQKRVEVLNKTDPVWNEQQQDEQELELDVGERRPIAHFQRDREIEDETEQARQGVSLVGVQNTELCFDDTLKVHLQIKEIRAYQTIIQMALHYQNKLLALTPEELDGWKTAQSQLDIAKNQKLRGDQPVLTPVNQQKIVIDTNGRHPKSSRGVQLQSNQDISNKVQGEIGEEIMEVNQNLFENSGQPIALNFSGRDKEGEQLEVEEEFESAQSFDSGTTEEDAKKKAKEYQIPTLAELVRMHSKRQDQEENRGFTFRMTHKSKSKKDDNSRKVFYAQFKVLSKGFAVAIDDDMTQFYDDSLIQIGATHFSYDQKKFYSDVMNPFRADNQFLLDREIATQVLGLDKGIVSNHSVIDTTFEALYFNHKSFFKESLIEPYQLQYITIQERPLGEVESTIKSKDILNINLTYGCLISLYQALQGVIDEEEQMAQALAKQNYRDRRAIFIEGSASGTENNRITEDPREDGSDVFSQSSAGNSNISGVQESQDSRENSDAMITPKFQKERGQLGIRAKSTDNQPLVSNLNDSKGDLQSLIKNSSQISGRQSQFLRNFTKLDSEIYDRSNKGKKTLDINAVGLIVHQIMSQNKEYNQQREKLMPRVKFVNETGKPIKFWLSNEKTDFELAEFEANIELRDQMFDLGYTEGTKKLESDKMQLGKEQNKLSACLEHLLSSYNNEELNRAQIYLNIAIDDKYHMLNNISLFQMGLFGYKIKKFSKSQKSQYCLLRMVRTGNHTTVFFESIAVVFNNTKYDLQLLPFVPAKRTRVVEEKYSINLPGNKVTVLPLTWFEKGYQAIFEDRMHQEFDVSQSKRVIEEEDEPRFLFKNGPITKVLNPNITEPYADHATKIKLNDRWYGIEFAMLGTRTKFGQFVITISTLTEFVNLMMTKITVTPLNSIKVTFDRRGTMKMFTGSVSERSLTGGTEILERTSYDIKTSDNQFIPELNLEQEESKYDSEFEVRLQTSEKVEYSGHISLNDLKRMEKSSLLGFEKGIIVEMRKLETLAQSASILNPRRPTLDGLVQDPEFINCVFERQLGPGCLFDTEYNNFGLRKKIFHHRCCYSYELYAPFIAVNQTNHTILLSDKNKSDTMLDHRLPPKSNAYINLSHKSFQKQKIRVQIPGHEHSKPIDLKHSGTHGILSMLQLQEDNQKSSNKVEVATSITMADEPYEKTRVLRIVQRFVIVNRLNIPIVIQEPDQSLEQVCLWPKQSMDYNFLQKNKQAQLRLRMLSNEEQDVQKSHHGHVVLGKDNKVMFQDGHWSHYFPTVNIGDFQVSLPQVNVKTFSDREENEISTSREGVWEQSHEEEKREGRIRQRGWNITETQQYVRVTITNDQIDQGKLFILISTPHQPEYLLLNYLPYQIKIQQKIKSEHMLNTRDNDFIIMDKGKSGRILEQTASPLILNPLHRDKDKLEITLQLDPLPLDATAKEREQHAKLQSWINKKSKTDRHCYIISKNSKIIKLEPNFKHPGFPYSFVCRTRKSGSMRIIEIFEQGQEGLPDEIGALSHDDQMVDISAQVMDMAIPLNPKTEEELEKQVNSKFKSLKTLQIVKLQGIGLSLVDFQPSEICFISFEGLVVLQEYCQFQVGTLHKAFTKTEISLRNFQMDACQSEAFPVVLGPKVPYRNIERRYRRDRNVEQMPLAKPFLDIWFNMSEETVGDISTKSIEDIQISVADLEMNLNLQFVSQIQDLLLSMSILNKDQEKLKNSQVVRNNEVIMEMMTGNVTQDKEKDFENAARREKELGLNQQKDVLKRQFTAMQGYRRQTGLKKGDLGASGVSDLNASAPSIKFKTKEDVCPIIRPSNHIEDKEKMLEFNKAFVEDIIIDQINVQVTFRLRGIEKVLKKRGPLGFVMNLGSNFADISDSEFVFSELRIQGLQESIENLNTRFYNHYKKDAITQFYQLLGSQDILGNPSSFIKNLGRGTVELQNAPFDNIMSSDPNESVLTGLGRGVKSLVANTTLAISSSYASMSGSIYLGLKNAANAGITHQDLDKPLSFGGGLKKGAKGFGQELYDGVAGVYKVPRARVRAQGVGAGQIAKGVGQGALQFFTAPLNAPLRGTYNLSTGVKNSIAGKKFHKQRFRYPRHFDQNERMPNYDPVYAQALTSLRVAKGGRYKDEVCNYALDLTYINEKDQWRNKTVIITNESILLIESLKHLRARIPLREIRGMMLYFYDKTRNSVHLELVNDKVVRLKTNDPVQNGELMKELEKQLKQLQEQHRTKLEQTERAKAQQKEEEQQEQFSANYLFQKISEGIQIGSMKTESQEQGIMAVDDQGLEFSFEMIREVSEDGEDSEY